MPLILPSSPADGETVPYGSSRYTYFQSKQYWKNTQVLNISPVTQVTGTTGSLAHAQTGTIEITGFSGCLISKATVSHPAWTRFYSSSTKLANDVNRAQVQDPDPSSGIALEIVSVTNSDSYVITPAIYVVNSDVPRTNKIYVRVTNLSNITTQISVDLEIIQIGV